MPVTQVRELFPIFRIQYEFKSQNLKYTAFLPYFSIAYPGAIHHSSLAYGDIYVLYLIFYYYLCNLIPPLIRKYIYKEIFNVTLGIRA